MTDSGEAPNKSPVNAKESGLGAAVDFVTRVVAPASLLTAILYYFGYTRERALFGHFGVDPESLRFSTTDYLVRSVAIILVPVGTVLLWGVFALAGHYLLTPALTRANKKWRSGASIGIATLAVVLVAIGVIGLEQLVNLFPLVSPIALGAGAFLLEYAVYTAVTYMPLSEQLQDVLSATKNLRRMLIGALLLISAFWATAIIAQQRGEAVARAIEAALPGQPEAVVYSLQRLQITACGRSSTPATIGSCFPQDGRIPAAPQ